MLHCIVENCQFVSHMKCFSAEFLKQAMDKGKYLIPISGKCPSCKEEVFWADLIKQKKYSLNVVDFGDSQEEEMYDTQDGLSDEEFQ